MIIHEVPVENMFVFQTRAIYQFGGTWQSFVKSSCKTKCHALSVYAIIK